MAFSPNYNVDRQIVAVASDETDTLVMMKAGGGGWGANTGSATLDRDNSGAPTPVAVANSAAIAFPDEYDATNEDFILFVAIDTGSGDGDVYKITTVEAPGPSTATDLNVDSDYGQSNLDVTGLAVAGNGASAELLAGAGASGQTYFSEDGGESWQKSRRGPTGSSKTEVLLAPDFRGGGKAYTATSGSESAISVSGDKGVTWNQTSLIDTTMSSIIDLAPSPNYGEDKSLFMLTFGGEYSLWRSQNGGERWERVLTSTLNNVDSLDLVLTSPHYGSNRQVVFLAGTSYSRTVIWKSTDNGQRFTSRITADPATGAALPINAWVAVDDDSLFIGSYDGSNGLVYLTTNGGLSYSPGVAAGSQSLNSIALSPDYAEDGTLLAGNSNGRVYWSDDNGATFRPLPPDTTSAPLTGAIRVAFDPDYKDNRLVYATSNSADKGVYRFIIGNKTDWESIDSNLPSGGTLSGAVIASDGTLYATNSQTDGGMERCLNPTYPLGPAFETVTRGLSDGATLSGLWQHEYQLWTIDTTNTRLMTFNDSLTTPVPLISPPDDDAGTGTLINNTVGNVNLDWEVLDGATSYRWQLDYDTDFSSVPSGFEGDTRASQTKLPTLQPATKYYWRVRATQPVQSPWSEKRSFTTTMDTGSAALTLQSPKAGTTGVPIRPLFQWSAAPGADSYELLVATDVNFANPVIAKTGVYALPTTAWQSDVSFNHATTYYWKVRAKITGTYSAWSAAGAFMTESLPTPSPAPSVTPPPIVSALPMPTAIPPPAMAPAPPPPIAPLPPPAPVQTAPDWLIYIIGALLLTIILLAVVIMVMGVGLRRSQSH